MRRVLRIHLMSGSPQSSPPMPTLQRIWLKANVQTLAATRHCSCAPFPQKAWGLAPRIERKVSQCEPIVAEYSAKMTVRITQNKSHANSPNQRRCNGLIAAPPMGPLPTLRHALPCPGRGSAATEAFDDRPGPPTRTEARILAPIARQALKVTLLLQT